MITLKCYTTRSEVYHHAQLKNGMKFLPTWWKNLPPSRLNDDYNNNATIPLESSLTMRSCPGFVQLYKHSVVMPMWSDLRILVDPIGHHSFSYNFADKTSDLSYHVDNQWGDLMSSDNYQHIKLISPWAMFTDKPLKWSYIPPTWEMLNDMEDVTVMSGVDEYYYQNSSELNFVIRKGTEQKLIQIPYNMPLIHMIPLSSEPIKIESYLISPEEMEKIRRPSAIRLKFENWYYYYKNMLKGKKHD